MVERFAELNGWQQFGVVYGCILLVATVVVCVLCAKAPELPDHD